jgi:peptidoglycan L-alanyl-D-glutamate endopeptidase CwlK
MNFQLSRRSRDNLIGVDPELAAIVERAIQITKVDFAVTEGLRTVARQRELVQTGASQTMDSKHIVGEAVDLVAFIGGRISWELNLYDEIADAMREAAIARSVPLRWGGAWNVPDIRDWNGPMELAMQHYIDARRAQGRRPFLDGPHFELL